VTRYCCCVGRTLEGAEGDGSGDEVIVETSMGETYGAAGRSVAVT
jgi:hypothetical protein